VASAALLMNPLELLERLAVLVPPPRRPLLAYHGLLAPRAEWRSTIVPPPAPDDARADAGARAPRRWPWAQLLHRVFAIEILVCDRCGGPRRILGAVTEPVLRQNGIRLVVGRSVFRRRPSRGDRRGRTVGDLRSWPCKFFRRRRVDSVAAWVAVRSGLPARDYAACRT
jgi:hypothetical protein